MATERSLTTGKSLPVILIAAVVQGWALYALHLAVRDSHWPATQPTWLYALYAVALFVPITVQLLADQRDKRSTWILIGALAAAYACFGAFQGANVTNEEMDRFLDRGEWFEPAFVLTVLWVLILPFMHSRVIEGRWRVGYRTLFAVAARDAVLLAAAAAFTLAFWLILFLWQQLFHMLGIDFFRELFDEPMFVYPVMSLTFGIAIHLIGSVERLTAVLLDQPLYLLKWLAIVVALVIALFSVALLVKLPGMLASGERAISAALLLWLVAFMVTLLNAAFRDGTVERPYPAWIAFALRCVVPLLVIVAFTAGYALYVRVAAYGFTAERVWAWIVAAAACIFACGYAIAAVVRGPWMSAMQRVNVIAALFLIGIISLALTPVLSPSRIAANSQFALALEQSDSDAGDRREGVSPMHYLRFNSGEYGRKRLQELANVQNHPRAALIREEAAEMIARENRWGRSPVRGDVKRTLAAMPVYPAGKALDDALVARVQSDAATLPCFPCGGDTQDVAGAFLDLNADGQDEFLLILPPVVRVYEGHAGQWRHVGSMRSPSAHPARDMVEAVRAGRIEVSAPKWQDLQIGGRTYEIEQSDDAAFR
jgi:hypothetical protein